MLKSDLAKTYLGSLAAQGDREKLKAEKKMKNKKQGSERLSYTPSAQQVKDMNANKQHRTDEEQFNRKLAAAIKQKKKEKRKARESSMKEKVQEKQERHTKESH